MSPQSSIVMERVLLAVLCVAGWHICICILPQYHFVPDLKTWTEAQIYCRQMYTDLATVNNTEEMTQLVNTVSSAGHNSEVWIGLYSEIDWRWSDGFTGSGADYRNWYSSEPNFYSMSQFCVSIVKGAGWHDDNCLKHLPSICYRGTQQDPEFVLVNETMTWSSAQSHCRENYVELATVRNPTEDQEVQEVQTIAWSYTWIGLFRNPNFYWSDRSKFSFSNWDGIFNPIGSNTVICGVTSVERSGKWKFVSCEQKLPFVCYSPTVKRQVVKLKIKAGSSVDLNDPTVQADLLKKFQEKLKKDEVTGVNLKWRVQPDGKVFHKEEKLLRRNKETKTCSEI